MSSGKNSAPALAVHALGKRFGDRVAFDNISFEIAHGEVFGFLGPNGAGKTTTVRTLGTLIAPSTGSATIAGIPLAPENGVEIRRRIAIMPETPGLYQRLSVAENLECFAELYEVPEPNARIERALRAVNLTERNVAATRQLASRARRRVGGAEPEPMAHSLAEQRRVVEAFLAASCEGDFDALLAVLDPDVVFRADRGPRLEPGPVEVRGGATVARMILKRGTPVARLARPAIIDGQAGAYVLLPDRLLSVVKFTVAAGRVTGLALALDPDTLQRLPI